MDSQGCGMTCEHAHLGRRTSAGQGRRTCWQVEMTGATNERRAESDGDHVQRGCSSLRVLPRHSRVLMCTGRKLKRVCKSLKSG